MSTNYKELIESTETAEDIFNNLNEKSAAGNIPRVNDFIRILEDNGSFKKGDVVKVEGYTDTSEEKDSSAFTLKVEGGSLSFNRGDIDKKFQMVYDS